MARNSIRGPTSALTDFLRESGITPSTIARRRATRTQNQPQSSRSNQRQPSEDGEGGQDDQEATRTSGDNQTYDSDDLDEPEEAAPKKRKLTKAAQEKKKAQEAKKAKKKGKKNDDDDDFEDSDPYTALSKSLWTSGASSSTKPPVGSFENCTKCEKQFTVTKYTMAAVPGPGFLCYACAKASGNDPFKKSAAPKKRKPATEKRSVVNFEEKRFPSLASLCIRIITNHIDDVEALGNIGAINMDNISKAIARNRSLTTENAHLFYNIQNIRLTLYDATKITAPGFCALASLNPNLTSLRLDFCGRMDDTVISAWRTSLPHLQRLELLGPFLVRTPGWISLFESHRNLEGFFITQSPRFDIQCIKALVSNCKGLKELRLKEIGKMEDEFLLELKELKGGLTHLDLSEPSASCSEDALISLMSVLGSTLTHLDLSGHNLITDAFLMNGIKPYTRDLTTLALANVPELTDQGVSDFFKSWTEGALGKAKSNQPLISLDLSRNHTLSSLALSALLMHSGPGLTRLNINAWNSVSEQSLNEIPKRAKGLQWLDVGWCREMNDFVMKALMEKCEQIGEVKCWGCNKITENCPRKRGVNIYGIEAHTSL